MIQQLHKNIVLFFLLIVTTVAYGQPANDNCSDAIPITLLDGTCQLFEYTGATYDLVNGGCSSPAAPNIWFTFTAQGPVATINLSPAGNKVLAAVLDLPNGCGNLTGATELGCGGTINLNNLVPGTTYYIAVVVLLPPLDEIEICINNPVPPPNDDPCSATNIAQNGCVDGTTVGATPDYLIPNCPANSSIYYSYTLGPNTVQLDIQIQTNNITGMIGVALVTFPNGCNAAPSLASNNSYYCGPVINNFSFNNLTPGSTVYILITSTIQGAGSFQGLCVTEVEGSPPCDTNGDCASAIPIDIPNSAEAVCITGCNTGMPDGPILTGGGACTNMNNPVAWYSFNSGNNNTAVINFSSADLTNPLYALFNSCNSWVECNPVSVDVIPNTTYYIAVTDADGAEGNFDLCVTLLNISAPCITSQSLTIIGASQGSPLTGPFKKCEEVRFKFTTNFIKIGSQWIHSMMPVISPCFDYAQGTEPLPSLKPTGNASWNWYPAGTVYWKSLDNSAGAIGINTSTGNICIIGTPDCIAFTGGGNCSYAGTSMPAGWIGTSYSGTCSSSLPNLSYGDSAPGPFSVEFTVKIPCSACTDQSCNDYTVAIGAFADGQTGGWQSSSCNGHSLLTKKITVQCCTEPTMTLVDGTTCSNVVFFGDITLDPPNSTIEWTVVNANGVLGATSGSGTTFSQTLVNNSSTPVTVVYQIIPISPTGCVGQPQLLNVLVYPKVIANAGPDKSSCPGATVTLGGNPTAGGGAGAPYIIEWSTGESTETIEVSPTINTTYTVTVTDSYGCKSTDDVVVSVTGSLEVTIQPNPSEYCLSDIAGKTLFAVVNSSNSPFTYVWNTPWGQYTSSTIPVNPSQAGTFQVTLEVTDKYGCKGIGTLNVVINPAPDLQFLNTPTNPLCPIESFTIETNPSYTQGTTYYSIPNGFILPDGTILTDQMDPNISYWFVAAYIDPSTGCKAKDSFQINVLQLDDPVITQAGPFCASETGPIQLVASPPGGTWSGGVSSDGLFFPSALGAGTYNIEYTIGTGTCTKQTSSVIIVKPNPTPIILNLESYCINRTPNPILVTDIPGGTWSFPINEFGEVPLNTMTPGVYPIEYSVNVDGCIGSVSDFLIISDQPNATIIPTAVVCNADPGNEGKSKLNLNDYFTGGNTTGTWSEIPPLSGVINLGSNVFDFTGIANGTIVRFEYVIPAALPCTDSRDTLTITVDDDCDCPKLQFSTPSPLCNDNAAIDITNYIINAAPGKWSLVSVPTGSNPGTLTGTTFDATGKDPGSYIIRYTLDPEPTNSVCTKYIELTITVNPEVIYTMRPEIKVCNNVPVPPSPKTMVNLNDFFTSNPVPGTWNNDNGVGTNVSGNSWDFTGVPVGNYTFTFTSSAAVSPCKQKSITVTVIVTENCNCPELNVLTPVTTICSDDVNLIDLNSTIVSAEQGFWTLIKDPSGNVAIPVNNGIFNPSGKVSGSYTFQFEINISPPEDCDSTVNIDVVIVPQLNYQLQNDATVCNKDPKDDGADELDFSSNIIWNSSTVNGTWADTDGSGAIQTGNIWNFNNVPVGNYTFTFTPNAATSPCIDIPQTITIHVVDNCECPDLPALTLLNPVCNNQKEVVLNNPIGTTGSWSFKSIPPTSNPATLNGNIITIEKKDPGTYILRYTYDNIKPDCPDTAFVTLIIDDYKFAGQEQETISYCQGTNTIIDLTDHLTDEDNGGIWTEVGPSTAGSALIGSVLKIKDLAPGDYIFQYRFINGGTCPASSAEVKVKIFENPIADAGIDQELTCEKSTATIGGNSTSGANIQYSWKELLNKPIPKPNDATMNVTIDGTFILTVTEIKTGCYDRDTVVITSDPDRPQGIEIERVNPTCYGYKDGYIKISKIQGGAPPILYSFNGGPYSSINSWTNLSGSNNIIRIKDANGCELTLDNIVLIEPPLVTVNVGNDTLIHLGDTVIIEPEISIPDDQVSLITYSSDYDFINCSGCFHITVYPNQTTTYTVEVKDKNGCSDKDSKKIIVQKGVNIFIPNIFTPNGDGNNDKVFISTNDKEIKHILSFQIYDRWGEKVFEAKNFQPNDPNNGWDGNLKGQKCNPAVYVYWTEIELFDGTRMTLKGDVTLMR
jgi:gliding motility-associated-like protein